MQISTFESLNQYQLIINSISDQKRSENKYLISEFYQDFIEECWSQDPDERPTFDEIVYLLKNDSRFITDLVNGDEFLIIWIQLNSQMN